MSKKVYNSEVGGAKGRGRPHFRLIDGSKDACKRRWMGLAAVRGRCRYRSEWRSVNDGIVWAKPHLMTRHNGRAGPTGGFPLSHSGYLAGVLGCSRAYEVG